MAKAKDRMNDAVDVARPYVERLARDEDLHDNVKHAYESARRIYDELLGDRGTTGVALKVARDKDLQKELRKAVEELRQAVPVPQNRCPICDSVNVQPLMRRPYESRTCVTWHECLTCLRIWHRDEPGGRTSAAAQFG